MSAAMPDVSVVIAAYNCAGFVARAIASALVQADVTLEVLVVDDASTDETRRAVGAFAEADPRVRLIGLDQNGGPSVARNAGLAAARGDWVAVLDADDAYERGRLARLIELARSLDADMIADNFRYFDTRKMAADGAGLIEAAAPQIVDRYAFLRGARPFTAEADFGLLKPIFRRSFMAEHGLRYPVDARHGEDFRLYTEILLKGGRFVLSRVPGYLYSTRASGLSRTVPDYTGQLAQLAQMARRPDIAGDAELVRLLNERGDGLRRLVAQGELAGIVAAKNGAALLPFALRGRQNAVVVADWAMRAMARKSRRLTGRLSPQSERDGNWS